MARTTTRKQSHPTTSNGRLEWCDIKLTKVLNVKIVAGDFKSDHKMQTEGNVWQTKAQKADVCERERGRECGGSRNEVEMATEIRKFVCLFVIANNDSDSNGKQWAAMSYIWMYLYVCIYVCILYITENKCVCVYSNRQKVNEPLRLRFLLKNAEKTKKLSSWRAERRQWSRRHYILL